MLLRGHLWLIEKPQVPFGKLRAGFRLASLAQNDINFYKPQVPLGLAQGRFFDSLCSLRMTSWWGGAAIPALVLYHEDSQDWESGETCLDRI